MESSLLQATLLAGLRHDQRGRGRARRVTSEGARIHHGEHGVEEWQRGGTGQNNFVREGAQWDHIQDPCSRLSEAQSHLPRLCREEVLPL
ncbi:unnamed protein product [Pleuronectes platessa]|uniref:Uncharacterized protein n=1 Tax=Pleuronectes platessa TaxID=8262 RepID=A0A9N7Y5T7_PLEPL|nr:unnamed protein product [Pleuronectes platessa]